MNIRKKDGLTGAQEAEGIAVIIDVFRAFSTVCYCLHAQARRILPVSGIEEARALKRRSPDAILIGERGGKKLEGFDFGNSPTELQGVDMQGLEIIQTTHAGTQGLVQAKQAQVRLTGAFVNAQATATYIQKQAPELVTLVRMGWQAETPTDEDDLCAEYLESLLLNKAFDTDSIVPRLRASACSARFFDPQKPWSPASDFDLCLRFNVFDFAVAAQLAEDGQLFLCKVGE